MALEELLAEYARENGITAIGITPTEPFARVQSVLQERLEQGLITPFTAGDIEQRCDPRLALPGARTVLTIAVSYLTRETSTGGPLTGRISRYARGRDYHGVLREKLTDMAEFIRRNSPGLVNTRVVVDSGPLVERAVAARAGMGGYGENCSLYVPEYGSWVFLGEIITDLPLDPGFFPPLAAGGCGGCGECRRACPTGALPAPYLTVDHRCLSYLTQLKGFIPREFRPLLGDRLWGCDTCQEACPRNRQSRVPEVGAFPSLPGAGEYIELIPLLSLSSGEFKARYSDTALAWRGRNPVQRNALVVLGNSGDPAAVPALTAALDDPRPLIRGHGAWALGQLGGDRAKAALERSRGLEAEPQVREEIEAALRCI